MGPLTTHLRCSRAGPRTTRGAAWMDHSSWDHPDSIQKDWFDRLTWESLLTDCGTRATRTDGDLRPGSAAEPGRRAPPPRPRPAPRWPARRRPASRALLPQDTASA